MRIEARGDPTLPWIARAHPEVATWTTEDGRVIPIDRLGARHLENVLRYLERAHDMKRAVTLWFYMCGPRPQGEHAQDAFEMEMRALDDVPLRSLAIVPTYAALVVEQMRRRAA